MNIKQFKKKIWATIGLVGISIVAIFSYQPEMVPPPLPIQKIEACRFVVTNEYVDVVDGLEIRIQPGFVCDLASIPNVADDLIGIWRDSPSIRRAALLHDALYASRRVSRPRADRILWLVCLKDGTQKDKAEAIYKWVCEYGFIAWNRHTEKTIPLARKLVTVRALDSGGDQ